MCYTLVKVRYGYVYQATCDSYDSAMISIWEDHIDWYAVTRELWRGDQLLLANHGEGVPNLLKTVKQWMTDNGYEI